MLRRQRPAPQPAMTPGAQGYIINIIIIIIIIKHRLLLSWHCMHGTQHSGLASLSVRQKLQMNEDKQKSDI